MTVICEICNEEFLDKSKLWNHKKIHNRNNTYQDKEWLYDQYWNQMKSSVQIAKECNISKGNIIYWLKKNNIKLRSITEATEYRFNTSFKLYKNKEWLFDQYYFQKKTMEEIAEICQCGRTNIEFYMKKFDFKRRTHSETSSGENNGMYGKKHTFEWCKQHSKDVSREKSGAWNKIKKGKIDRNSLHLWIKRRKEKKEECEYCKKNIKLELSFNHSLGNYTRDPNDYIWLCHKCHMKRDWDLGIMCNQFTTKKI